MTDDEFTAKMNSQIHIILNKRLNESDVRLSELEKKFDLDSGHVDLHHEHKKEIAELKESIKRQDDNWENYTKAYNDQNNQLNELKEFNKIQNDKYNTLFSRYLSLEAVLRELGKYLIHKEPDKSWCEAIERELAKLGVGSAAHTEKPKMTDDEIMRFNEEIMAKVNKREVQPLDDSKPPEPKYKCTDCGECFKTYHDGNGWQNWVCPKCYTRINTTGEPREDEGTITYEKGDIFITYNAKLNKVVKREKIDFWRKELLNKTDEVLKSMREVLGIE